ncbi:alpha/beta fold hydrolase [Xylanimonas sp. McL0601]|uniref:alpha/beta fold hydrolase n=1 Tax=Xylanimonas sp. McL0601 TaxID=3414739 RepID=UPI003CF5B28F
MTTGPAHSPAADRWAVESYGAPDAATTHELAEAARRHPALAERVVLLGPVVDTAARSAGAQGLRLARDTLREPVGANAIVISDYLRAGPRWYVAQLRHMLRYRVEEAVADLACPVLAVRGGPDPVAPAAWVGALADIAPHGRALIVPGAARIVQYGRPRAVAASSTDGGLVPEDELPPRGTA